MKGIVVNAKAFSDAMSKVSRVLKKAPISILEEICVSVRDGICTLTATDLETWLTARLPVQGDDVDFVFYRTKDVMKALAHFDGELTMELSEQSEKRKDARKLRLYCGQRAAEYEDLRRYHIAAYYPHIVRPIFISGIWAAINQDLGAVD